MTYKQTGPFGYRPSLFNHDAFDAPTKKPEQFDPRCERRKKEVLPDAARKFDLKEGDPEKQGAFAVYLLMKGNFTSQLTQLLEERDTPVPIKLVICDFLVEGGFCDTLATVQKTLVEICQIGINEYNSNLLKKQQQQQQSTASRTEGIEKVD